MKNMKRKIMIGMMLLLLVVTGCGGTVSTDEKGNSKKEFNITETAIVNDTKIKVNSVKKVLRECFWEYDGVCQTYTEPDNAYFLVIDLTVENMKDKEQNISSIMSFDLKDMTGEKGKYVFLTKNITSQMDGTIMAGDLLKGQIAYDVKDTDVYYFYYRDSLLDDSIKFVINKSDIIE